MSKDTNVSWACNRFLRKNLKNSGSMHGLLVFDGSFHCFYVRLSVNLPFISLLLLTTCHYCYDFTTLRQKTPKDITYVLVPT